jgi:peptide/nickel transport system substrate-binding protein/2-iminobutanoate/2-iminopropanoate deaminase
VEPPFSPVREADGFVFLAGQGGFDENGALGDTIEEQTDQTLRNVERLLGEHGCSMADVLSCLVHLTDLEDFAAFNEEYAKHFPGEKPVRTTVRADLVAGMHVEITIVAKEP